MRMPSRSSSAVILVGRIVLLGIAAGALVVGFVASRTDDDPPGSTAVSYACPMHPSVTSSSPGDCPICRMALQPVVAPPGPSSEAAAPTRDSAGDESSRSAFTLPFAARLHLWDATAVVGPYETSLEMRAPAWAESAETAVAVLHRDESELLQPNEEALFFPSSRPRDGVPPGIKVHVVGEPSVRADRATSWVRFHVDADARLSPQQTGSIKLAGRIRKGLVVKDSAVLESTEGPYVLVVTNGLRTLTKRPIEIGNVVYGYAAVISGVRENERVATSHTFSLDAERRLRGGAQ